MDQSHSSRAWVHSMVSGTRAAVDIQSTARKGIFYVDLCALCDAKVEASKHQFFACEFAYRVWGKIFCWLRHNHRECRLKRKIRWAARKWRGKCGPCQKGRICGMLYQVWQEKDNQVFKGYTRTIKAVVEVAKSYDYVGRGGLDAKLVGDELIGW
ncbi:hypothetical protein Ancab_010629, partial [Ancistrocladus abbreviatus]